MESNQASRRKTGRPLSFDRDRALEQAMLAFWRHGYETTSIADLTRAMGITAPSLYTAFGDKKRLFLAAVARYAGDPADMAARIAGAATARAAAQDLLAAAATGFTGATTPGGCLLASAAASGSDAAADVQRAIADIRAAIAGHLQDAITRDIGAGVLPPGTDAAALAGLVIAVIQGLSVLARDGVPRDRLNAIGQAALAAWPMVDRT
ncbi:TetR/AcrR family transcriptional regulator [Polymorphobacter fuscus]|uniref:TetR family transcriptional regulator n=1 Tax=Sandarakinorhabdus fusca TaxID=1439888 RepID=A0A7C9GWX2_9SPHN|nr:TetR/AcrR family transcriptional regulator [Polymorphobacter fuscus]KAB7644371.1 TetR/AcrR family transcriptional regulator [Polymorphobacter fuscus]MQT18289.1 TetR family transcriptional regulator [Polymorphobacter fuscus]NJC08183.1 AcrR family transcriptional regulator [Polymorphobacter fuscus]